MYVRTYIHTYVLHTYTYIHIHTHTYIHIHTHTYVCFFPFASALWTHASLFSLCRRASVHWRHASLRDSLCPQQLAVPCATGMCLCVYIYVYLCACVRVYTHTYTYTYKHTHTHTQALRSSLTRNPKCRHGTGGVRGCARLESTPNICGSTRGADEDVTGGPPRVPHHAPRRRLLRCLVRPKLNLS
jgi:hypothetical protein